MHIQKLHPWQISPREAIAIQKSMAAQVVKTGHLESVKYVAGADVSTEKNSSLAHAGVVVMSFPGLELVEEQGIAFELSFPYIPGLLAFREAPPLLKVFEKIEHEPDLILFDGQGIAHPRGMGIASHVGLLLNKPSIGCAKSLLTGHFEEPAMEQGSFSYLYAPASGSAGDWPGGGEHLPAGGQVGGATAPHGPPQIMTAREVLHRWEELKRQERGSESASGGQESLLESLPKALPALILAHRVQERVSRVGFDWPSPSSSVLGKEGIGGVLDKVREEFEELEEAIRQNEKERIGQELGDVLFSLVNLARFTQVDPEGALRETTHRFIDRFKEMDRIARAKGRSLHELSLEEMDVLWEQSKNKEKG